VHRQPNMRLELTARSGRMLQRNELFFSAAAAGCSSSAIR